MQGHQIRGFIRPTDKRYQPNMADDKVYEERLRDADRRFYTLVLEAIWRGDNVEAGKPKPVRPLVLRG